MPDPSSTSAAPESVLGFSLCDPNAALTRERRQARDEALNRLADARRKGPTTEDRVDG